MNICVPSVHINAKALFRYHGLLIRAKCLRLEVRL